MTLICLCGGITGSGQQTISPVPTPAAFYSTHIAPTPEVPAHASFEVPVQALPRARFCIPCW
jgi:hypothetical protein